MALSLPTLIQKLVLDPKEFEAGAAAAETRFVGMSGKMAALGGGLTKGVTLPILGIGIAAVAAAETVDKAHNTIIQKTGAVGKELDSLEKSFAKVASTTGASFDKVATVMSELHTQTGLVGKPLEDVVSRMLTLGRVAKEGAPSVTEVTKAFNAMGVPTAKAAVELDHVYLAAQKTGVPMNAILSIIPRFAPQLQRMGYSFDQSAAFIAKLTQAGIPVPRVMMGIASFMTKAAKAGEDPQKSFAAVTAEIQKLVSAGGAANLQKAGDLAASAFGRSGLAIVDAMKAGRFSITELVNQMQGADGQIGKTGAATMTLGVFFGKLKNQAILALAPIGQVMLPLLLTAFGKIFQVVNTVVMAFSSLPKPVLQVGVAIALAAAAIGPMLLLIVKLSGAWKALTFAVQEGSLAFVTNPIFLFIAALVAVGVAVYVAYQHFEGFRNFIDGLWQSLQQIWDKILVGVNAFKSAFSGEGVTSDGFVGVMENIGVAARAVFDGIVASIPYVVAGFQALGQGAQWLWSNFLQPVFGQVVKLIMGSVVPVFRDAFGMIADNWKIIAAAIVLFGSPIIGAFALIVGAVLLIRSHFEGFKQVVSAVAAVVIPIIQVIAIVIRDVLGVAFVTLGFLFRAAFAIIVGIFTSLGVIWNVAAAVFKVWVTAISLGVQAIIIYYQTLWSIAQVVWQGIQIAVSVAWAIIQPIWNALRLYVVTIIEIDRQLLVAFTQVWTAITQVAVWAWQTILYPIWTLLVNFVKLYIETELRLLQLVFTTVWTAITTVATWAWTTILQPLWNLLVAFLNTVLMPVFRLLQTVFTAVWQAIQVVAGATWGAIKGVWDGLVGFVNGTLVPIWDKVKGAFVAAWDFISGHAASVWNTIKGIFTGGLQVIGGVVSKVLSIAATIANAVGAGSLATNLTNWSNSAASWGKEAGGVVGGAAGHPHAFAAGGLPPAVMERAMARQRKTGAGFMTDGPRAIVGEGSPHWPEFVVPTDPRYRDRALALHGALTDRLGFAEGGIPRFDIGGIWDATGGKVVHAIGSGAATAFDWVKDRAADALGALWHTIGMRGTLPYDVPAGAINKVRQSVIDFIQGAQDKKQAASAAMGGPPGGPGGPAGSAQLRAWISEALAISGHAADWIDGMARLSMAESGGNPKAYNPQGLDPRTGGPGPEHASGLMQMLPSTFRSNMVGGRGDIWNPVDNAASASNYIGHRYGSVYNTPFFKGGPYKGYAMGGLLPANVLDKGGYLPPGASIAINGTGRKEGVLAMGAGDILGRDDMTRGFTGQFAIPKGVGGHAIKSKAGLSDWWARQIAQGESFATGPGAIPPWKLRPEGPDHGDGRDRHDGRDWGHVWDGPAGNGPPNIGAIIERGIQIAEGAFHVDLRGASVSEDTIALIETRLEETFQQLVGRLRQVPRR